MRHTNEELFQLADEVESFAVADFIIELLENTPRADREYLLRLIIGTLSKKRQ